MDAAHGDVEAVDHPAHYNQGTIEPIDVIEDWGLGFCLGNTVKYVARAEHKAAWYLQREIGRRETALTADEEKAT